MTNVIQFIRVEILLQYSHRNDEVVKGRQYLPHRRCHAHEEQHLFRLDSYRIAHNKYLQWFLDRAKEREKEKERNETRDRPLCLTLSSTRP